MSTVGCVSVIVLGMRICCKFLILDALGLVIFPLKVSGPFICNDLFASSGVNGQLRKIFVSKIFKNFGSQGILS